MVLFNVFDVTNKALEHTVTNQNIMWLLLLGKKKQLTCLLKMEIEPFNELDKNTMAIG